MAPSGRTFRSKRGSTGCACSTGRTHASIDRKSTRLNSSHLVISYAVFCLKKQNKELLLNDHKATLFVHIIVSKPSISQVGVRLHFLHPSAHSLYPICYLHALDKVACRVEL